MKVGLESCIFVNTLNRYGLDFQEERVIILGRLKRYSDALTIILCHLKNHTLADR